MLLIILLLFLATNVIFVSRNTCFINSYLHSDRILQKGNRFEFALRVFFLPNNNIINFLFIITQNNLFDGHFGRICWGQDFTNFRFGFHSLPHNSTSSDLSHSLPTCKSKKRESFPLSKSINLRQSWNQSNSWNLCRRTIILLWLF